MFQSIRIGDSELWLYNILMGIGLLAALFYTIRQIEKRRYFRHESALMLTIALSALGGLAGAHLIEQLLQHRPLTLDNLLYGGSTFLGGLLTGSLIAAAATGCLHPTGSGSSIRPAATPISTAEHNRSTLRSFSKPHWIFCCSG